MKKEIVERKEEEKWEKPKVGWMQINCDEAYKATGNEDRRNSAGIGVVIRDETGRVCSGVAKKVRVQSSLEAKAAAIKEGIILAEALKYSKDYNGNRLKNFIQNNHKE